MVPVSSNSNKWVKYVKKLSRRRFRDREGKFVLEGVRAVEEGLKASGAVEVVIFSASAGLTDRGSQLLENAAKTGMKTLEVNENVMSELSNTETPQGVLAVVRRREVSLHDLLGLSPSLLVVVDSIRDPGNLGTIIRASAGAGACGIILMPGTVDLYNPKTLRSLMGNIFQIPIVNVAERFEVLSQLEKAGLKFVIGEPGASKAVFEVNLTVPVAIVIGSEAHGVQPDIMARPGYRVNIPMSKGVESLNVAVAAGILLYEVIRQRHD